MIILQKYALVYFVLRTTKKAVMSADMTAFITCFKLKQLSLRFANAFHSR